MSLLNLQTTYIIVTSLASTTEMRLIFELIKATEVYISLQADKIL